MIVDLHEHLQRPKKINTTGSNKTGQNIGSNKDPPPPPPPRSTNGKTKMTGFRNYKDVVHNRQWYIQVILDTRRRELIELTVLVVFAVSDDIMTQVIFFRS